jgi:hypothetical protein
VWEFRGTSKESLVMLVDLKHSHSLKEKNAQERPNEFTLLHDFITNLKEKKSEPSSA